MIVCRGLKHPQLKRPHQLLLQLGIALLLLSRAQRQRNRFFRTNNDRQPLSTPSIPYKANCSSASCSVEYIEVFSFF